MNVIYFANQGYQMRYARYVLENILENSKIRADRLNLNGEKHVLYHFDLQSCFHESNLQNCRSILLGVLLAK